MRIPRSLVGAASAVALLAGLPATPAAAAPLVPATATVLAPGVSAYWEMDEEAGSTLMHDSGPNGLNAPIDPTGVDSGFTFDGATGYHWERRPPAQPPVEPERVIQVPDNAAIEPGDGPFTIEMRYRTAENFGNITQKGQANTTGGQWKIQAPQGIPSCLFKGSNDRVATGAKTALNDERWHNLTCVLTDEGVTMYVDGEFRNRKRGFTGTIDNSFPMTIGGKIDCDQDRVTCDYFSGDIDFIKITQAENLEPTAAFDSSCFGEVCTFDSSASADPDGSLTGYAWDFGDGTTSTLANPTHTYAAAGTYSVQLVVTDNQAASSGQAATVVTEDAEPVDSTIQFVAAITAAANRDSATVTVPLTATEGDRMLLVLGYNNLNRTVGDPAGWTRLGALTSGSMGSVAWTRVVGADDPGQEVSVPFSGNSKFTLTLADYTGTSASAAVAFAGSTFAASATTRTTPVVTAAAGDWGVSYWADKSGSTTAWTASDAVTTRDAACAESGGRVCSLLADSAGPLTPGPYGNVEASTDAPSDQATMWTFVLKPSTAAPPANVAPTAAFSASCPELECAFDSTSSSDPDGSIADYDWDFGDGATSTEASPVHAYAAEGSYDVTLTVTDDDGDTGSVTETITVPEPPAADPLAFVDSVAIEANNNGPNVDVPATASVGDRLVMALSINKDDREISDPTGVTGWTLLDNVAASDMRTAIWTKVVEEGDPGTRVQIPMDSNAKHTLTVAVYSGVDATPALTFAATPDTAKHVNRVTPAVPVPEGAWVVSYWADKSSSTTSWTPVSAVTGREMLCGDNSGRICSLLADSGGPLTGAPYSGATAATDDTSGKATAWSIVLPPAG
ncbi:PKD domain-containing protein [Nocardioides sp. YIM 152588]|uniref:PKD domain-containing protein n=1 Tax=Nocardioides sp. YIM 152588 TaxID=3158259 RepID=UPI0032E3B20D